MAPPHSCPLNCNCCTTGKCICPGDGKDCSCECCKRRSCTCREQAAGGQQQGCKCPCCEKKSCTCKEPSDCGCACCQKHTCPCPGEAHKKKTEACNCCCCKSDTKCCTESRHQQSCDCRCCKEETCKCCKSQKAGAAHSVAGKNISGVVYDRHTTVPDSSSSRPYWQADSFWCSRGTHWSNNCSGSCRHCIISPNCHMHGYRSQIHCCRSSTSERQCSNTNGGPVTDEETRNSSSDNSVPRHSAPCPSCCSLSYAPYYFVAPRSACCGCSNKQHGSYCQSRIHPCDAFRCCKGHISSICWRCSSMRGAAGSTVLRSQRAVHAVEADQSCEKRDSTAFPYGGSSSSSSATEQGSEPALSLEHPYAPEADFACARCHCCCRGLPTRHVVTGEHEMQQRRCTEMEKTVNQPHGRRENQQQQLQKDDEGQKSNSCILDPAGRLLVELRTKEKLLLRRMQPSDYPAVRALLPEVSRCTSVLTDHEVHDVLSSPVFYAWCCFTVEPTPLPPQHERQDEMLAHTEKQQQEVEKQVQQPANQQQTEQLQRQSQQRLHLGRQQQQDTKVDSPECYTEKTLVAYCELLLQPRLGRKTDGRLERVVVDKAFRGRGVASVMCSAVINAVKESRLCGFVDLTVEKDEARHIYEDKLGFREVATTVLRLQL